MPGAEPSASPGVGIGSDDGLGEIARFRELTVVPYEVIVQPGPGLPMAHQGGPLLPHWDDQTTARFCRNGVPVDQRPPQPAQVRERIDEPSVWCGPCLSGDFGHQIADFSTRILQGVRRFPSARFLFAPSRHGRIRCLNDAPQAFRAMLDWFGVPSARTTLITTPTRVSELYIPPQAEQLAEVGPSPAYLDLLDECVAGHFGSPGGQGGTLYVSRAGQTACLAGEAYLEELLRRDGIAVIRPECLPLLEQLRHYHGAGHLIVTEGSALHGLQLLGRNLGELTVLSRRPGRRVVDTSLRRRVRRLAYHDLVAGLIHGTRSDGRPRLYQAIAIPDEQRLAAFLDALRPGLGAQWEPARHRQARDHDLLRWLKAEALNPASRFPGSGESVLRGLRTLKLERFIPAAKAILPTTVEQ